MAKLRLGTSYWLDRFTGSAPRFPRLRGRHTTDIAIVGGNGMTFGYLAAQILVRDVMSTPGVDDGLFGFGRTRRSA